jgi:hypothetical protein
MSRKSVLINPADVLDPRDMPPLEDELEQLSIQASNSTSKVRILATNNQNFRATLATKMIYSWILDNILIHTLHL